MRLLLLTNCFPNIYDPTKAVFNFHLARALAREHEVRVISPLSWVEEWRGKNKTGATRGIHPSVKIDGVEVHYPRYYYPPKILRRLYGWCLWRSVRKTVWQLLQTYTPDAVLGYWAYPDGEVAIRIAHLIGVPAVIMIGGSDVLLLSGQGAQRSCVANVVRSADAVITASSDLAAKVVALGTSPENVRVVYKGVDTGLFSPGARGEARRRLGIPSERATLLWVGRMVPVKGLDVLLEASSRLQTRGVNFRLHLVGDGPLRKSLAAESRRRGLSEVVSFEGRVANHLLADWYRAADMTVLPSRSEGVPNVLRESLACGTPFVASRVGGIPEITEEPANCLVPPGDAAALAEAIEQGLAGRGSLGRMRSRSTGWEESAASLVEILEPLVKASQNPDRPWWSGKQPATIKATTKVNPFRFRQLLQRVMAAVLPHRLFLVHGRSQTNSVSLTFDDGPHPEHTPQLLEILKRYGIRATFFVVGRQAELHPELVRRIAAEGHDVANHSYFHAKPEKMLAREAIEGIRRTQQLLRRLVGEVPSFYRPPYGKLSLRKLLRLWWEGMSVVLWNVDPRDYSWETAAEMADWFRQNPLRAGDIVLFHDRLPHAGEVLPELIEATRNRGLAFVPISHWKR